jgi:hypothetical protein
MLLKEHLPQERAEWSNTCTGGKLEAIGMTVKSLAVVSY